MDATFLARRRDDLLRVRGEILVHLAHSTEGFRSIVEAVEPKDEADLAADDVDKKNLEAVNAVEARKLPLIDSALARIDAGRYGVCPDCSRLIPEPRLEALPYALFCVECQGRRDKLNRQ